jgi:hypothetical protein
MQKIIVFNYKQIICHTIKRRFFLMYEDLDRNEIQMPIRSEHAVCVVIWCCLRLDTRALQHN